MISNDQIRKNLNGSKNNELMKLIKELKFSRSLKSTNKNEKDACKLYVLKRRMKI